MKLLISNYDGTFKPNIKKLKLNIELINEFMNDGNLFCLVTTRPYLSIKRDICIYDIHYSYLICNDGSIILNRCDNPIYIDYIPLEMLLDIQRMAIYYDVPINLYDRYGQNADLEHTVDIGIMNTNPFYDIQITRNVRRMFNKISINHNLNQIYIHNRIDKVNAINKILDLENLDIDKSDIITVGNSIDDTEMLKKFNGYKVLNSNPFLYGRGINTCFEVKTLVKKLMN